MDEYLDESKNQLNNGIQRGTYNWQENNSFVIISLYELSNPTVMI